jgi:hypothetical protein
VFSLATVSPCLALASPESDADRLIDRGIELRQHGKDEEALAQFKEALALSPTPRARAQVALAEQALGAWVAAERELARALAATKDPWIVKNRAALEGALGVVARHLGNLEVRGTDGAEIVLDGVAIGTLPASAPFRVEAGPRTLELRKPGYYSAARTIEVAAGGVTREAISLAPLPAAPPESPTGTEKAAPTPPPREVVIESDRGHVQRLLGWTFAITGVSALAVGGVGLGVRTSLVNDYNDHCPGLGVAQPSGCDDEISDARTWMTVSTIALVAGGILTIGGVTLVVTAPSRSAPARASSLPVCAPSLARPGLACSLVF